MVDDTYGTYIIVLFHYYSIPGLFIDVGGTYDQCFVITGNVIIVWMSISTADQRLSGVHCLFLPESKPQTILMPTL